MDELGHLIEQFAGSVWNDSVVWFGGLWVVLLFIRKVFKNADDELDPEKRQSLSEELTRNGNWAAGSWIPNFTLTFDRFFGKKHLRWRCFYKSSLISIVSFAIIASLTGLWSMYNEANLAYGRDTYKLIYVISLFAAAAMYNVFQDYLSLLETRTLLNTSLQTSLKILVDIFLTVLLFFICISSIFWVTSLLIVRFDELYQSPLSYFEIARWIWYLSTSDIETILAGLEIRESTRTEAVLRYYGGLFQVVIMTSFTTSIWLWLHGFAQLMIRSLNTAGFLMSWLNVKDRPLRAIGTTINAFVLLIGVVLFPIFVIAG